MSTAHEIDYKTKVELGYDKSSSFYEQMSGEVHLYNIKVLLHGLSIPDNPSVLDVGCGTGLSLFAIYDQCGGRGSFQGVDLSSKMIEQARSKAEEQGYNGCVLTVGDAEKLEYPDNYFDLIISNSVFHWFLNKKAALQEMYARARHDAQLENNSETARIHHRGCA